MLPELVIRSEQKSDYEEIKLVNDLAFDRPDEGHQAVIRGCCRIFPGFRSAASGLHHWWNRRPTGVRPHEDTDNRPGMWHGSIAG